MEYQYNKKSLLRWILRYVIIAAVAYGAVYYFYFYKKGNNYNTPGYENNSTNNTNQIADWNAFLINKVYADGYTSGHVAIFKADHTLPSAWGLDYAGPNDARAHSGVGSWEIQGSTLFIRIPSYPEQSYDVSVLQQEKVNGSVIVGSWSEVNGNGGYGSGKLKAGFFIGDNAVLLSQFSNTNFNTLAAELPK